MEALKVTFTFSAPLVMDSEYPIHLDGLVAWCAVDEAESLAHPNPWSVGDELDRFFKRACGEQNQWVWQASRLHFTPASERLMMNMVRKCEPILYMNAYDQGLIEGRTRGYINTGSGQDRAYQFLMPYQWFESAEAWCIGDRVALTDALNRLKAIGKLTRNGFGTVKSFEVEPDASANDLWRRRTLPLGVHGASETDYVPSMQCLRAPYWKKTHKVMTLEPICM